MHHVHIVAICTGMTNVFTNEGMFNIDLNPLYRPTDTVADATLKQIESDIAVDTAKKTPYPTLVYCPRLSIGMNGVGADTLPVSLRPAGDIGKLHDKATSNVQLQSHMDVAEMFSLVVNSGTSDDYNEAATRYRQMFGEQAKSNNAGYFVFHGGFQPRSGWQERYEGPPFNFLDAFETGRVVHVMNDPWVRDWLIFWLRYNAGIETDGQAEDALTHVYVSHSASLCWSLLLQGRQETAIPNMVPRAIHAEPRSPDAPMATVWQDQCVYLCGPTTTDDGDCKSDVDCKSKCLQEPRCKGYYLKEGCAGSAVCGAIVFSAPVPNDLANGKGDYNHFYEKNLYADHGGRGIAFNEQGTFPVAKHSVKTHVYKKRTCDPAAPLIAGVPHAELVQCEDSGADRCIETTNGQVFAVGYKDTVFDCTYVHDRISRNVPSACRAVCLETDTCIAWTWDTGACTHYTGVGQLTASSVVPDLGMLEDLGMDTSHACGKPDEVFDKCVQKCVHIRNKLHHGWCNHQWVNCKAGKFAEQEQAFIPEAQKGHSVCTGGFHPENPELLSADIAMYKTGEQADTYNNYGNFKFPRNYGHESNRQPVSVNGRTGAYTATRCGDIGAYVMHIGKSEGNTTFLAWQLFSKNQLNTNVEGRMSKLVADQLMHMHDWPTRTFVSMAQGSSNTMDGNAYASPIAGTSSIPADGAGRQDITFPKCQISYNANQRLYSFTLGNQCVNRLNKNTREYYEKSISALAQGLASAGTPYYGTAITQGPEKSVNWAAQDVDRGLSSGLYTRATTSNAAKHLICYRREPRMTTGWGSQHGDSPGYAPYAFEGGGRRRVAGTDANQFLTSTRAVLIDSHTSEQCKIHQTPRHLVVDVAFERAYGDNEDCYVEMSDMKDYYDLASTTSSGTTLRQFPRGVGCKPTVQKTLLLSGFQPFYSRVIVDREIVVGHSYYYTRHDGTGTSYKSFVDGTPTSGSTNSAQCKRGTAMRNDAINFMARACVEGPRAFFSRAENLPTGTAAKIKNSYPPCCKLFQIDDNCDMYFYSVSSSPVGVDGIPVAATSRVGESRRRGDSTKPFIHQASTEGWPHADVLIASWVYKGFAYEAGLQNVCPGMTALSSDWTDAEYAFAAAHPDHAEYGDNTVRDAPGTDVYMVHNPAMRGSIKENDHDYKTRRGDENGYYEGTLPRTLPSGPSEAAATGHGTSKCASAGGYCTCQGVLYYGTGTDWFKRASFTKDGSGDKNYCHHSHLGSPVGEVDKSCYCHAMPDMYFKGSRAYGVPVLDPEKFTEISHHQGDTDNQYALDALTYQQQCWAKCKNNRGDNAYCIFTGARFHGEVATMGEPTCYLSNTCEKELSVNTVVASFREKTIGTDELAEGATLDDLKVDGALTAETLKFMHPSAGNIQNAQRAFADGGTKEQASTYHLVSFEGTGDTATRNANVDADKTHWKMHVATVPKPDKTRYPSKHLPKSTGSSLRDVNAANAGLMCPTGVHVGGRPDAPLARVKESTDGANWHPLAQTTLMCPHNKPVRCSKLVIVDVVGGTCEYSSETGKQKYPWSGATAQPIAPGNENMENWKSKFGQNAPCHVYDFACHSISDDIDTQVCGRTSSVEDALGGVRCGIKPGTDETGGFCGVKHGTTTNLNSAAAGAHCAEWPTGARKVCPDGFAYLHMPGDTRAKCVPGSAARKNLGVLREHLAPFLVVDTASTAGQFYAMSSCDKAKEVATADGRCVTRICADRKSKDHCEVQDVDPAHSSCTWSSDNLCVPAAISPTPNSRKLWWPGFLQKTGAFSGVGPAYVNKFDKCKGKHPTCKGFDKCGKMDHFSDTECIDKVLGMCCRRHGVSMGMLDKTCEASPSTMCAGGRFMYNTEDSLDDAAALTGLVPDSSDDLRCPTRHPFVADHISESAIENVATGSVCCRAEPTPVVYSAAGHNGGLGTCEGYGIDNVNGKTVSECTDICKARAGCVAFVYYQPGVHVEQSQCSLKSTCGTPDGNGRAYVYVMAKTYRECIASASVPCSSKPAACTDGRSTGVQTCSCHQATCEAQTEIVTTSGKFTLETAATAGYKAELQELFLALVDKETGIALPAEACTGPTSRLEGAVFPSCACQPSEILEAPGAASGPVYEKPGSAADCLSDDNCIGTAYSTTALLLYTHVGANRTYNPAGYDSYLSHLSRNRPYRCNYYDTCAPEKLFPGQIAFTEYGKRDLVEPLARCQVFDAVHRARHWCVGLGDSCAYLTKDMKNTYCALPAHPAGGSGTSHTVYQKHTAYHSHVYALQNVLTSAFGETIITMFDASAAVVCSADPDCVSYKVVSGNIHLYKNGGSLVPGRVYTKGVQYGEVPTGICADYLKAEQAHDCRYKQNYTQKSSTGLVACTDRSNVPQPLPNATYEKLTHACQKFTTDLVFTANTTYDVVIPAMPTQCPPLLACVHGTNVRQGDQCVCRCDDYFAGPLCDRCTSANRDETCRACKDNFMTGQNDVCICQPGFDLNTTCTTCKPGFEGVFCQTSTCAVKMQEAVGPLSYTLKNVAIAYDAAGQLYDGVIGAGDGRVPYSMQNTFVKAHGKTWFLYASPAAARVQVTDAAGLPTNTVHNIAGGEWLYSIPEKAGNTTVADIVADEDTWGYVCTLGTGGNAPTDVDKPFACATTCDPTTCGSWHWNNGTCTTYALTSTQEFTASEHNIDTRNCRSGGVRLAGKYRNLPAMPSLAVPNATRMLQKVPGNMLWTVVCAYGNGTANFILSEYRRHPWTGGPCAQRVQLTWLYSLPRGPAMDVTTPHYHGLARTTAVQTTVNAPNAAACAAECKAAVCEVWVYDGTDCMLSMGDVVATMSSDHGDFPASNCVDGDVATFCHSSKKEGDREWLQLDLGSSQPISMVKIWNRVNCCQERLGTYYVEYTDDADGVWDICGTYTASDTVGPFDAACVGTAQYVRIRLHTANEHLNLAEVQVFRPYTAWGGTLKPTNTFPVPANMVASMSSQHPNYPSANCIDGNTGNMCHSDATTAGGEWLQLDLGSRHRIYAVKIWNRNDGSRDRLGLHELQLSNDMGAWTTCGTYTATDTVGPFQEECLGTARYVRIHQLTDPMYLNLAEVQVLRSPVEPPYLLPDKSAALPDVATSISTVSNYRECCYACAGSASWQMAGARCSCFDGGKVNGEVGKCYVPTMPAAGETCNVAITMADKGAAKASLAGGTCFSLLKVTNYEKPEHCGALCLDEEECDVAHYSTAKVCTLLQCTRPDLAEGGADAAATDTLYIKEGACVQQANSMCHYRPRRAGYASGACSANGASVAYQADVRLYYNDDNEGNSVPMVAGQDCSDKLEPALPAPFNVLLHTADTNLLMHRFDPGVYPSTTGFNSAPKDFNVEPPTSATPAVTREMRLPTLNVAGRRRRVPQNALGVAPNQAGTFQITQAIAVPIHNQACHEQARLATVMAGLKSSSVEQGRCSGDDPENMKACTREKHYTSALESIQAAYVQQLASCHTEAVAMDNALPIQLMMYVQPRAGLTRIQYHGLPTYYAPRKVPADGFVMSGITAAMEMGSFLLPEVPTPILPVFETPSPTPSPHIDNRRNIECTLHDHCCFEVNAKSETSAAWHADENVLEIQVDAVHTTDAFTGEQCMELCARFLLCRVVEWRELACHMWSLPIELSHLQHGETFWVQPPDTGCLPSASIAKTGIRGGSSGAVYIKQDCCLRHMLH